jgi:hypothetical protein
MKICNSKILKKETNAKNGDISYKISVIVISEFLRVFRKLRYKYSRCYCQTTAAAQAA